MFCFLFSWPMVLRWNQGKAGCTEYIWAPSRSQNFPLSKQAGFQVWMCVKVTLWILLVEAATSIFVATKVLSWQTHVYHDKHVFVKDKTCLLLWQKYVCRDKKKLSWQKQAGFQVWMCVKVTLWILLAEAAIQVSFLLRQKFCCDKHVYHDKHVFVKDKTCLLSRQKYVCRDKVFLSWQKFCHDKHSFVTTKVLSWQAYFCHGKRCFVTTNMCVSWQTCCDKSFVLTKIMLVAASANNIQRVTFTLGATSDIRRPQSN